MGPREGLVLLLVFLCIGNAFGTVPDGLYITNSTHILYSFGGTEEPTSVFKQDNGRIVGLAVDTHNGLLFWSDIGYFTRGIYKAHVDPADGKLTYVERIIATDVAEVNGISVDYAARHVYFTDGRHRTLELVTYDGKYRRTLDAPHDVPRGVVADPVNGYLFWNDQGVGKIERSRLDGSERTTIVQGDSVQWPNQMVMRYRSSRLLWVDARSKKLMSSGLNGQNTKEEADLSAETEMNAIYGLAVSGNKAYVSVWNSNKVLMVDLLTGSYSVKFFNLGSDVLFSMAFASKQEQKMPTQGNACAQDDNGGCQYLCLPITSTTHHCGCPTYGGLVLNDDGTCSAPAEILLYALADQGEVGFVDISLSNSQGDHTKDRYTVGRSMRPVAVAYDPVQKKVYWSDVHERSIHVSNLDGSGHRLFLTSNNSLGIVDGMAVDIKGRRLYFSNMDMVAISGASYSWHKIEAIGLDGTGRRTVVETAEKPRGLFIDQEKRQLFYTDWGSQAAVVRVDLDGSSPKILLSSALQNPNSVVYDEQTGHVYVVDSFYKSRKPENLGTFGDEQNGKLFKLNGDDMTEIALDLTTPFGLAIYAGYFYISDWDTHSIVRFNMNTQQKSMIMSDVSGPMALHYAEVSMEEVDSGKCDRSNCDDMCFELSNRDTTCTCDSYDARVLTQDDKTCAVSTDSLLIADLSSLHIRSLQGTDDSTYNLVGGNTFTNIVSLVHDRVNGVVYFSDVNRRNIYKVTITTGRTELFRTTDDIIDGMTLNKERTMLYWTDFFKGTIAYTDVREGDTETINQLLVRGLDKPRAIVLDEKNNYMYWTEWGEHPRVARARLSDGSQVTTIVNSELVTRPNGLDLDLENQKLYVGDAGKDRVAILKCSLNDNDAECQALPYTVNVPQHIYSIKKIGSLLYYTDWLAEELAMIDMRTGKKLSIVENLMRPTEFWFNVYEVNPSCPSGHTCFGTCLPHMTGYTCTCPPGQVLRADDATCTVTGTGEWMEAPDSCAMPCKDGSVCARTAGTTSYACVCKEGYKMVDGMCMECDENTYQPFLNRSPTCQSCPSQATSNRGATQCRCPSSLAWNHHTGACTGTKPGECPSVSIQNAVSCSGPQCEQDGDCPGAQRCCADSYCATPRCQDPINLWECVFEGRLYAVGEVFHPDACVRCSCEADKMYASSLYGGATCSITNCPSLDCDKSEHYVPEGACCPMCKTSVDQPVHINNCPEEPHELDLPNSSDMARLNKQWDYSDALKRRVEIRQEPPDRYLPWIGNGRTQDVRVEALAAKSNGDWDKDVCELQVIVNDNHRPVVTCPSDIKVMASEFPAQVRWTPAQYEDNVCGRSDCVISSFPAPGSDFGSGVTTVQYTVEDEAGNRAECSFKVSVYEPESPTCVPPMIYNGYLDCSGGSQQTCAVTCSEGYIVYRTPSVSCKEDTWSPPITEVFQHFACAKKTPKRSSGSVTIRNVQCPSSSLDSLNLSIREYIQNIYLGARNDHVTVTVTSHGCGPRKRRQAEDVMLTIKILLEADVDATMSTPLEDLLRAIKDDTNDARLCELWITNMEDDEDCGPVEASITMPSTGCQPGQETHDTFCIECPVGTYETGGKCELCPEGQYQGVEGQTQCHPCSEGLSAPEGSVFESDCVVDPYKLPIIPIIIGAVVAGIVLLMIISAIVFWMFRRKRHGSSQFKADPNSYHNSAYDAENVVDNPYVNSAKRPYENLVKKDEMDEKEENLKNGLAEIN